jgi:hypothetical protein
MVTKKSRKPTSRERILNYGGPGAGKSTNLMMIAEALPEVPFYIIDTDDTTERLLEDDFSGLHNVEPMVVEDWAEFTLGVREFLAEIDTYTKSGETPRQELPWLGIDMSDVTWDWAQAYFVDQVFNEGIDEYFIRARKELEPGAKKVNPMEGWVDWPVINKIFQARWNPLTKGRNYHLFLTAKGGDVRREEKQNRELYDAIGSMPTGEKRMGHRVHTILFSSKTTKKNEWHLTTAKDRGRKMLDNEVITDFAGDYLEDIAGWEL